MEMLLSQSMNPTLTGFGREDRGVSLLPLSHCGHGDGVGGVVLQFGNREGNGLRWDQLGGFRVT